MKRDASYYNTRGRKAAKEYYNLVGTGVPTNKRSVAAMLTHNEGLSCSYAGDIFSGSWQAHWYFIGAVNFLNEVSTTERKDV